MDNDELTHRKKLKPSTSCRADSEQSVTVNEGDLVSEGLVRIKSTASHEVFYNPVQVFNRDLSIIVIKAFAGRQHDEIQRRGSKAVERCKREEREPPPCLEFVGFDVLEPLAATGLRALRYLSELKGIVNRVVANDLDFHAVETIQNNAAMNGVPLDRLIATCSEGARLMYAVSFPFNIQHGTVKKIRCLPAGSSIPISFDMRPLRPDTPLSPLAAFVNDATASALASASKSVVEVSHGDARMRAQDFIFASLKSNESGQNRHDAVDGKNEKTLQSAESWPLASPSLPSNHALNLPLFFDIVDVDPYGSVAPFIDSAVQAVRPGGLLCLTSTDMPVLCGNSPEVSFYKYGGTALKARYIHEMALRLVLHAVGASAAKYRRIIVPLLSCSVDFYVRLFIKVLESPEGCRNLQSNTAIVHQCVNCDAFRVIALGSDVTQGTLNRVDKRAGHIQNKRKAAPLPDDISGHCAECGSRVVIGGPFYAGPLYDTGFIEECLQECAGAAVNFPGLCMGTRITGLLTAMKEELQDVALYYHLPSLCQKMRLEMLKPSRVRSALVRLGYRVSHFHRDPQAIKTDAPVSVVFDIMRTHAVQHPPKNCEQVPLLKKQILTEGIDLTLLPDDGKEVPKIPRWLPNPSPHWGPKSRANSKRRI